MKNHRLSCHFAAVFPGTGIIAGGGLDRVPQTIPAWRQQAGSICPKRWLAAKEQGFFQGI